MGRLSHLQPSLLATTSIPKTSIGVHPTATLATARNVLVRKDDRLLWMEVLVIVMMEPRSLGSCEPIRCYENEDFCQAVCRAQSLDDLDFYFYSCSRDLVEIVASFEHRSVISVGRIEYLGKEVAMYPNPTHPKAYKVKSL